MKLLFLFPVLGALALAAAAESPTFYRITDLGTLGGRESRGYALNEKGQAAGEAETKAGVHAFVWSEAGGLRDLGTLGGATSRAYGINTNGWVVGESDANSGGRLAFLWRPDAGMTNLALPAGALAACAYSINDSGVAAGAADTETGNRAAMWPKPGEALIVAASGMVSMAFGINPLGRVVGQGETGPETDRVSRAFKLEAGGPASGLVELPQGNSSAAQAVNGRGQIAGQFETGRGGQTHAFLFDPTNGLRDLDTLNNTYSAAYGLNNRGQVVGTFFNGPADDDQAFLYSGGEMFNLNDLLDTREDWRLLEARAINDAGGIAGFGLKDGQVRAFLLTPMAGNGEPRPQVKITAPPNGAQFKESNDVELVAAADGPNPIKRITFYADSDVLGSATQAPFRLVWTNVCAGDRTLSARAVDVRGQTAVARGVRIAVELQTALQVPSAKIQGKPLDTMLETNTPEPAAKP